MRDHLFSRALASSEPTAAPEPLTADIRALCRSHLPKGDVIGENDDPLGGDRF
jgi:hypothetical protein